MLSSSFLKKAKLSWETLWYPVIGLKENNNKKTNLDLERDKKYEIRWIWYHTILAIELLIANGLLLWIAINV